MKNTNDNRNENRNQKESFIPSLQKKWKKKKYFSK